ncbi:hypothetical protein ERJ75_001822100 [Trypanosoma vivax]|nr:hypothetical protein ERJ75_001822100 [Trypanosoma vivax]
MFGRRHTIRNVSVAGYHVLIETTRRHMTTAGEHKNATGSTLDPPKLDLKLRLDQADFSAMVKATKMAMMREKLWKEAVTEHEVDISRETVPESLYTSKSAPASKEMVPACARDDKKCEEVIGSNAGEHGGLLVAEGESNERLARPSPRSSLAANTRYGLMDTLRDCLLSGDWSKGVRLFEAAVEMSSGIVTATSPSDKLVHNEASSHSLATLENKDDPFEVLRRINATTPSNASLLNVERPRGILRWGGGHFFLLMKLLLSRHRIEEAERLWEVMKRIGYVEYHMDNHTFANFTSLVRGNKAPDAVASVLQPKKEVRDRAEAFRLLMARELDAWAQKRHGSPGEPRRTSLRSARSGNVAKDSDDNQTEGAETVLSGKGLKVGDFAGLLRRCNSNESTCRVLSTMEKHNVVRDGPIYSSLIASLRQPHYALTPDDNVAGRELTKEEFDAHRRKRLERAREWFMECPENNRTIDVFNEMLLITRGGAEEDMEYDKLLMDLRGAPLSLDTEKPLPCGIGDNGSDGRPRLVSPHWRVQPNGRTYEILLTHCKYKGDWPIIWALYNEMMERNVRGTPRLYQLLLEVARLHPPQGRQSNSLVMELYHDMRRQGIELTEVGSTVSIVNAWCATRRRRRW